MHNLNVVTDIQLLLSCHITCTENNYLLSIKAFSIGVYTKSQCLCIYLMSLCKKVLAGTSDKCGGSVHDL